MINRFYFINMYISVNICFNNQEYLFAQLLNGSTLKKKKKIPVQACTLLTSSGRNQSVTLYRIRRKCACHTEKGGWHQMELEIVPSGKNTPDGSITSRFSKVLHQSQFKVIQPYLSWLYVFQRTSIRKRLFGC